MARYQQGIGVPETLGVQPTMWKEPTFNFSKVDIPKFNVGVGRNYGSPGSYVDTMPSRYKAGRWETLNRLNRKVGNLTGFGATQNDDEDNQQGRTAFSRTSSSFRGATDPNAKERSILSDTYSGMPLDYETNYRRSVEINKAVGGFSPPEGEGLSVPTAPKSSKGVPSLGLNAPPVPGTERNIFAEMGRAMPDLSASPSGATFRDEPVNPFPQGNYEAGRALDPSYQYGRRRGNKRNPI